MARHPLKSPARRRTAPRVFRRWILVGIVVLLGLGIGGGWWWWQEFSVEISRRPEGVRPALVSTPPVPAPVPVEAEPDRETQPPELVIPPVQITPAPVVTNQLATTSAPTNPPLPALPSAAFDIVPQRPPTNILEAQIALTAYGIGSGPIDGLGGAQTAWALRAFQFQKNLEETGRLDWETSRSLKFVRPLFRSITITEQDLQGLRPVPTGWLGKSQALRLGFASILEKVAEESHAHPNLVRRLNPTVNWAAVPAGATVVVPNANYPAPRRAALVRISLANRYLRAFDARGSLLAHFPCSIGRIAEKRPVGELNAVVVVKDPNYTFNPAVFAESAEARQIGRKLLIPPGPNNPVGITWIGLNRPGYGIHGTPNPEQVGRTESHGCFRLANWNADYLRQMMAVGTPVWVEL